MLHMTPKKIGYTNMRLQCLFILLFFISHYLCQTVSTVDPTQCPKPNVTRKPNEGGVLFFNFLGYKEIYNEDIWREFFKDVPTSQYRVYIHLKEANGFSTRAFEQSGYCLVPSVWSDYCRVTNPMNELLFRSLNDSFHQNDHFIFLSSDTIPIKSFSYIYNELIMPPSAPPHDSNFCITPTLQWIDHGDNKYTVKHHHWISLNRVDVIKSVGQYKAQDPDYTKVFAPYTIKPSICFEEHWHYTAANGVFDSSSPNSNSNNKKLIYPYTYEQGRCITYVFWPDAPRESIFRQGIVDLEFRHHQNAQTLLSAPLQLIIDLHESPTFLFMRKIRSESVSGFVEVQDGGKMSWLEGIKTLNIYSTQNAKPS